MDIAGLDAWLERKLSSLEFREELVNLLLRVCEFDTSPSPDIESMRKSEDGVFCEVRKYLLGTGAEFEFRRVNPSISSHASYSQLHFTKTSLRPDGLPAEDVYENRGNLLLRLPSDPGVSASVGTRRPAVNAHIDVVAPFIPPRLEDGIIYGRGTADDKGSCVVMAAAAKLLLRLRSEGTLSLPSPILFMFAIEEETGGNGSLSLALDAELGKEFDSLLVLECADGGVYPGNRGAVWYRTELTVAADLQLAASVELILALEEEGAAIYRESDHPMFPHRPVQTCHGMIGAFGEHPSRICAMVSVELCFDWEEARLRELILRGIDGYCKRYGDKALSPDSRSGKPRLVRHYQLERHGNGWELTVFGLSGHMGSIRENDGAITKLAWIMRALYDGGVKPGDARLLGREAGSSLLLEGGQGFLPTHSIDQIMERIASAAESGFREFCRRVQPGADASCKTEFEKLHNAAFAGKPDAPAVKNALRAAEICGLRKTGDPVRGWDVSCDARLFASERPDLPVITSGPGQLSRAHADDEQISLDELLSALRFTILWILLELGIV